jgi:hypothetical protein
MCRYPVIPSDTEIVVPRMNQIRAEADMLTALIGKVSAKRVGGLTDVASTFIYLISRAGATCNLFCFRNHILTCTLAVYCSWCLCVDGVAATWTGTRRMND